MWLLLPFLIIGWPFAVVFQAVIEFSNSIGLDLERLFGKPE